MSRREDGTGARFRRLPCLPAAAALVLSAPASAGSLPPGFARLADAAPGIAQDMRYAGPDNFTGEPVPGYHKPECWLRAEAARALADAQEDARAQGFALVVYDCYRPRRAVDAFLAWSRRENDQSTKERYYPGVEKRDLFAQGYIAERSSHSTGLAVDIGIAGRDFGTPFDYFDPRSWPGSGAVSAAARTNRERLAALMRRHGFKDYAREWWHFTFAGASGAESFDIEIK